MNAGVGGGGEICARRNTGEGGIRYEQDHSLGAILSAVPLRVRTPLIILVVLTSPLASFLPLTASWVVVASGGDFLFWRFGGMVDPGMGGQNALWS